MNKLDKKINIFLFCLISFISLIIFTPNKSFALSLEIGPDEIMVQNVVLGKPVAVSSLAGEKMKLKIINKDATSCIYTIDILRNAQTTAPLTTGYVDIPQVAWIYPQVKEIKVPGKSFKEVELFINVPQDKKYARQKYQAVIEVKTKKNRPQDFFVLACQLKLNFSTVNFEEAKMCKNKKIFILTLVILAGVGIFYVAPVFAGASITLTGESDWDMGTKGGSSITTSAGNAWTVTNSSGGTEDLYAQVTSSGNWTAICSNSLSVNQFSLTFDTLVNGPIPWNFWFSTGNVLRTLGNNEVRPFGLTFRAPPVGSEEGEHILTVTLTATNWHAWSCGDSIGINHTTANGVAPVDKYVTYGTVLTDLSGASKCWITQNLGADYQASSLTDERESSAGWYWQFNRKQGYKHDGTTLTPSEAWVTSISETSDWTPSNDPCTIELGEGWRMPTTAEWGTVTWNHFTNGTDAYNSVLKLHAAGSIYDRIRGNMGVNGYYWATRDVPSTPNQDDAEVAIINGNPPWAGANLGKVMGFPLRCLKD